jgi:pimeloyl-ACP methyl ester carboxylesterase
MKGVLMLSLLALVSESGAAEWTRASLGAVELEYQVRGSGEPVVFVHAGVFADWFGSLVEEPALRSFQLVTYHRIGYSGSSRVAHATSIADQAAQLHSLLAQLGLRRVHLVGHSSGALIAMQLALDARDTVQTLTLLEPALPIAGQASPGIASAVSQYRAGQRAEAIDSFMRTVAGPEYRTIIERAIPRAFEQAIADAPTFFEYELPAVRAFSFGAGDASRLRAPVLVVMGERSDEVSPIWRQRHELLLRWIPGAEAFVLPEATHLLQLQNPRAMAQHLAAFLARHASSENRDRTSR